MQCRINVCACLSAWFKCLVLPSSPRTPPDQKWLQNWPDSWTQSTANMEAKQAGDCEFGWQDDRSSAQAGDCGRHLVAPNLSVWSLRKWETDWKRGTDKPSMRCSSCWTKDFFCQTRTRLNFSLYSKVFLSVCFSKVFFLFYFFLLSLLFDNQNTFFNKGLIKKLKWLKKLECWWFYHITLTSSYKLRNSIRSADIML